MGDRATLDENRRRRRRRRRIVASAVFLSLALSLAWFFESQATTTVIFARYAETIADAQSNAGLSPAGHVRAKELARVVGDIDVVHGLDAIFATQYRSTQETAEPIAELLQIPVQVVDSEKIAGLTELILREYKRKIVLVITDPVALPLLVREFQGSKHVPAMIDGEHDNLYIVSIPWYGKVKTLRLRFGTPISS